MVYFDVTFKIFIKLYMTDYKQYIQDMRLTFDSIIIVVKYSSNLTKDCKYKNKSNSKIH